MLVLRNAAELLLRPRRVSLRSPAKLGEELRTGKGAGADDLREGLRELRLHGLGVRQHRGNDRGVHCCLHVAPPHLPDLCQVKG
eukprot:6399508-Alexandrium_andersonii.AAC.1